MRVLAWTTAGFAAAILAGVYLPIQSLLFPLGAACAGVWLLFLLPVGGRPRWRRKLICCALGLTLGFSWGGVYRQLFYAPAAALDGKTVRMTATVLEWPKAGNYGSCTMAVRAQVDGTSVKALLTLDGEGLELQPGDRISTIGHCERADLNFAGEDVTYYLAKGIFLRIRGYGALETERPERVPLARLPAFWARGLKNGVMAAFPDQYAPLVLALVTGNRDDLSAPYTSSLQRTGLSHTVAVSGMHLAFLAGLISLLLGRGKRRTALTILPVTLIFMLVAGSTPSIVRASVMILLLELAPLFGRERDGLTALSLPLLLMLVQNPFAAAHIGLQLSFASVAGILLCAEPLQRYWMERSRPLRKRLGKTGGKLLSFLVSTCCATVGAMVFTTPLSALHFEKISLISPLSNLLTLWAVSGAFSFGLIAGVLGALCPAAGRVAALPGIPFVHYLQAVVPGLAKLPLAAVTTNSFYYRAWLVFAYGLLAGCFLLAWRHRDEPIRPAIPITSVCAAFLAALLLNLYTFRMGEIALVVLDVGQGQSVLLRLGDRLALLDCGGSREDEAGNIAADYLQDRGYGGLDYLILSHYHGDHANGIPQLLERVQVNFLYAPDVEEGDPLREEIFQKAQECGTQVQLVSDDIALPVQGEAVLTLFGPLGEGSTNELGLTVLASAGDFDVLVTGDMGSDVEQKLLAHTALPDIEVLVAGHHGSEYSTSPELLEAVRPEVICISVGAYNRYGHPSESTLNRMEEAGAEIYRTDQNGTIAIQKY